MKVREKGKARLMPVNGKMDCADVSTAAGTVSYTSIRITVFEVLNRNYRLKKRNTDIIQCLLYF